MPRLLARSFTLQLIALCTVLGVLWAPIAEASVCADEPEAILLVEQHGEPGADENLPEKHGTCAHGHCHHASQAVGGSDQTALHESSAGMLAGTPYPSLDGSSIGLATPPPRA